MADTGINLALEESSKSTPLALPAFFSYSNGRFNKESADNINIVSQNELKDVFVRLKNIPNDNIAQTQIGKFCEYESITRDGIVTILKLIGNQLDLNGASGIDLDAIGAFFSIPRKSETRTRLKVLCSGEPNTVIPEGSLVSNENGYVYSIEEGVTIDNEGNDRYAYAVSTSTTYNDIDVTKNPINSITSGVVGWKTVLCNEEGMVDSYGAAIESDEEYRARIKELRRGGISFVEPIESRLKDIDGLRSVAVVENGTGEYVDEVEDDDCRGKWATGDNGEHLFLQPPHSITVIVDAPTSIYDEIAECIYRYKSVSSQMVNLEELSNQCKNRTTKTKLAGITSVSVDVETGELDSDSTKSVSIIFNEPKIVEVDVKITLLDQFYYSLGDDYELKDGVKNVVIQFALGNLHNIEPLGCGTPVYGSEIGAAIASSIWAKRITITSVLVKRHYGNDQFSGEVIMTSIEKASIVLANIEVHTYDSKGKIIYSESDDVEQFGIAPLDYTHPRAKSEYDGKGALDQMAYKKTFVLSDILSWTAGQKYRLSIEEFDANSSSTVSLDGITDSDNSNTSNMNKLNAQLSNQIKLLSNIESNEDQFFISYLKNIIEKIGWESRNVQLTTSSNLVLNMPSTTYGLPDNFKAAVGFFEHFLSPMYVPNVAAISERQLQIMTGTDAGHSSTYTKITVIMHVVGSGAGGADKTKDGYNSQWDTIATALKAVKNTYTVCSGISYAHQVLFDQSGVQSSLLTGSLPQFTSGTKGMLPLGWYYNKEGSGIKVQDLDDPYEKSGNQSPVDLYYIFGKGLGFPLKLLSKYTLFVSNSEGIVVTNNGSAENVDDYVIISGRATPFGDCIKSDLNIFVGSSEGNVILGYFTKSTKATDAADIYNNRIPYEEIAGAGTLSKSVSLYPVLTKLVDYDFDLTSGPATIAASNKLIDKTTLAKFVCIYEDGKWVHYDKDATGQVIVTRKYYNGCPASLATIKLQDADQSALPKVAYRSEEYGFVIHALGYNVGTKAKTGEYVPSTATVATKSGKPMGTIQLPDSDETKRKLFLYNAADLQSFKVYVTKENMTGTPISPATVTYSFYTASKSTWTDTVLGASNTYTNQLCLSNLFECATFKAAAKASVKTDGYLTANWVRGKLIDSSKGIYGFTFDGLNVAYKDLDGLDQTRLYKFKVLSPNNATNSTKAYLDTLTNVSVGDRYSIYHDDANRGIWECKSVNANGTGNWEKVVFEFCIGQTVNVYPEWTPYQFTHEVHSSHFVSDSTTYPHKAFFKYYNSSKGDVNAISNGVDGLLEKADAEVGDIYRLSADSYYPETETTYKKGTYFKFTGTDYSDIKNWVDVLEGQVWLVANPESLNDGTAKFTEADISARNVPECDYDDKLSSLIVAKPYQFGLNTDVYAYKYYSVDQYKKDFGKDLSPELTYKDDKIKGYVATFQDLESLPYAGIEQGDSYNVTDTNTLYSYQGHVKSYSDFATMINDLKTETAVVNGVYHVENESVVGEVTYPANTLWRYTGYPERPGKPESWTRQTANDMWKAYTIPAGMIGEDLESYDSSPKYGRQVQFVLANGTYNSGHKKKYYIIKSNNANYHQSGWCDFNNPSSPIDLNTPIQEKKYWAAYYIRGLLASNPFAEGDAIARTVQPVPCESSSRDIAYEDEVNVDGVNVAMPLAASSSILLGASSSSEPASDHLGRPILEVVKNNKAGVGVVYKCTATMWGHYSVPALMNTIGKYFAIQNPHILFRCIEYWYYRTKESTKELVGIYAQEANCHVPVDSTCKYNALDNFFAKIYELGNSNDDPEQITSTLLTSAIAEDTQGDLIASKDPKIFATQFIGLTLEMMLTNTAGLISQDIGPGYRGDRAGDLLLFALLALGKNI